MIAGLLEPSKLLIFAVIVVGVIWIIKKRK